MSDFAHRQMAKQKVEEIDTEIDFLTDCLDNPNAPRGEILSNLRRLTSERHHLEVFL